MFLGSDATQWSWCTVNWTLGEYARGFLSPAERERIRMDTRRRRPHERQCPIRGSKQHRNALYIGVVELAAVVYGALLWGHGWRDKMVIAITDSTNAIRWIRQGRARNGYAAFLLRLLARLQLQHGFSLWAEYVSSEENELPDCGSRRWLASGELDPREIARWDAFMATYSGSPMREVVLSEEERCATEWLSLSHPRVRAIAHPWWRRDDAPGPVLGGPPTGGRAAGKYQEAQRRLAEARESPGYVEQLEREMASLVVDAWAKSTNDKYETSRRQFVEFCHATNRTPTLTGANPAQDSETLALYVTELAVIQELRLSTIQGKLAAIGWFHVQEGLPNPTKQAPLLKCLLRAVKRRQGESTPKQPVTSEMLRAARAFVVDGTLRGTALWAGLLMAFGFLLRASEYLAYDSEGLFEDDFVIRWSEVAFRCKGEPVESEDEGVIPDEVVIKFRGSKSDRFRAGCVRNLFATGLDGVCPVEALWDLARAVGPERRDGPVMAVPGEDPIGRNEVASVLKRAAVLLGESTEQLTSHSLRAGGATALYAAGYGEAEITYHGRWASASWLVYVHRTVARSGGVARAMFKQNVSLLRLAAGPSGRMGGNGTSKRRGGGRPPRGVTSPPGVGRSNPAPINRTLSSTPPRAILSGSVQARVASPAPAQPVRRARGPSQGYTPTPGRTSKTRSARVVQQCVLQSMFGYGSPVGSK